VNEYRVAWQQMPFCNYERKVSFVEARDGNHAEALVKDYVERTYGITYFKVREAQLYEKPEGGRVL